MCSTDEALLLVRHGTGPAGGEWRLPTVVLEPGETLAEAVVRAGDEQGQRTTLCGPFIGWSERPDDEPPALVLYFESVLLDADGAAAAVSGPPGVAEVRFVPLHAVSDLRLAPGLPEVLAEYGVIDTVV
jgi:ADP-ribose pyrophosphatase YjhB (NUDIX family)